MTDDYMQGIPQEALNHYNRHYSNTTYRAFRTACAAVLPDCMLPADDGSLDLMNLLLYGIEFAVKIRDFKMLIRFSV